MDCVTSRFYLGESLDPVDELRVENDIRTLSTRLAHFLHIGPNTHQMCIELYDRLQVGATTNQSQTAGEGFTIEGDLAGLAVGIPNHAPATTIVSDAGSRGPDRRSGSQLRDQVEQTMAAAATHVAGRPSIESSRPATRPRRRAFLGADHFSKYCHRFMLGMPARFRANLREGGQLSAVLQGGPLLVNLSHRANLHTAVPGTRCAIFTKERPLYLAGGRLRQFLHKRDEARMCEAR